jgi:CheY-like chemotaxis protein/GAF domain-containing protein
LAETARALDSVRSLPELLDLFVGEVADQLDAGRASLMLLDPDTGTLRIAASRGLDGVRAEEVSLPLGHGVAGAVAVSGQARLSRDEGRKLAPDVAGSYVSAPVALSFPVRTGGNVIGVINVTNRRSGDAFDERDLARLEDLAHQLALGLERAHHVESLERAYRTLDTTEDRLVSLDRLLSLGSLATDRVRELEDVLSVVLTRTQLALLHLADGPQDTARAAAELRAVERVVGRATAALRGHEPPGEPVEVTQRAACGPAMILLIEDDDLVRQTFEDALSFEGHRVTAVGSAQRALTALDEQHFDLVITDLSMPGMSGLELARRVKQREVAIPVVLISGWVQDDRQVAAAGIDLVVGKPCAIEELLAAVATVRSVAQV